eukprot:TRINITY_DN2072_c0_g1_i1.p1 TRINITY_DN2072_c0_g1~~TRINITY_DN2072_c0_g1_i1.p1  ORF type:complete len:206 (+),score=51.83 TRINITY_DN2072_c0_g1_i1:83-700(+)
MDKSSSSSSNVSVWTRVDVKTQKSPQRRIVLSTKLNREEKESVINKNGNEEVNGKSSLNKDFKKVEGKEKNNKDSSKKKVNNVEFKDVNNKKFNEKIVHNSPKKSSSLLKSSLNAHDFRNFAKKEKKKDKNKKLKLKHKKSPSITEENEEKDTVNDHHPSNNNKYSEELNISFKNEKNTFKKLRKKGKKINFKTSKNLSRKHSKT